MKGILHLLVISGGLFTSSYATGLDIAHEDDRVGEIHRRAKETNKLLPSANHHELTETQSIFRDFEFTRSLRQMETISNSNDVCLSFKESCSGDIPCCRGGCNSKKVCFCAHPGGLCFKPNESDNYCCSGKCGSNGRCKCIAEGASCAAGNGFCCGGLTCGSSGRCVASVTSTTKDDRNTCNPVGFACSNKGQTDTTCCSKFCGSGGKCKLLATPAPSTRKKTDAPIASVIAFTSKSDLSTSAPCSDSKKIKLTIDIQTDKFGADVGWSVSGYNTNTNIANVVEGVYGVFDSDQVDICLVPGLYNFVLTDKFGDGVCCQQGDGHVKLYLNDREVMHVKSYGKVINQVLNLGYDPTPKMTTRDIQYLDAHNRRRFAWYVGNGVSDVPLVWSPKLAEESRVWAAKLLENCTIATTPHEHGVDEGENLAENYGYLVDEFGRPSWGQLYPPDSIVGRWVDFEVNRPYPGNAHLTQVLWRASKYMGCGEASKSLGSGKMCRTQVCRYARAGNCDMSRFNATAGKNWLAPMLAGSSRCGPDGPPEGLF